MFMHGFCILIDGMNRVWNMPISKVECIRFIHKLAISTCVQIYDYAILFNKVILGLGYRWTSHRDKYIDSIISTKLSLVRTREYTGLFFETGRILFLNSSKIFELQSCIIGQKKQKFVGFCLIPVMRKSDPYFFNNLL